MNIAVLKNDLRKHGELHLVVEEHEAIAGDEYIGLRRGNSEFDDDNNLLRIKDSHKHHVIGYDRIVYYNTPIEFPD